MTTRHKNHREHKHSSFGGAEYTMGVDGTTTGMTTTNKVLIGVAVVAVLALAYWKREYILKLV